MMIRQLISKTVSGGALPSVAARGMSSAKFTVPDLEYDYASLEPFISGEIMQIHHSKHHAAYVANLNIGYEKLEEAVHKNDVSTIIATQQALKFNGGGHLNHSIFWKNLISPKNGGGEMTDDALGSMINAQWGSLDKMQAAMSAASVGVQGSGWGWLGYDKASDSLKIATTANQDPLQATTGLVPLLGIDVWEHA